MSKQTAVEWLVTQLRNQIAEGTLGAIAISKLKMQSKAMEREQIMNAWAYGVLSHGDKTAEQYYNETYKGDNK